MVFYYFNFENNYEFFFFLRSKSPCILLNKNIALIKTKPNRKWKIPHTFLERRTFSSHKNRKLKIKLWWVAARERKFFAPFILPEATLFLTLVLFQYIAYWIHFQNFYTFTHQKTLLHTLFCLFLKSSKAITVSLNVFAFQLCTSKRI